ncbi:MAG TPA: hypothetical protein VM580_32585 [Labilithrix sp.]|jgi:hypothetical protein|nr:hypothetical protein [Labilithrix sp.]
MVFKAVSVVLPHFVGAVFAEEQEARAWLLEKRREHFARKATA